MTNKATEKVSPRKTQDKTLKIKIKKLHPEAHIPTFKTSGAVGADLTLIDDITLNNLNTSSPTIVGLGITLEIPTGYHAKIFLRSSIGAKTHIRLANGTGIIDSDYRGELKLILEYHARGNITLRKGMRIAQIMIEKNIPTQYIEVQELTTTTRGEKGIGSTGI